MTPEHARQLLGGLAAGILTPEERQTLFEAALHDQALFNEVADELEFAAFLQSPQTRAQLANRIEVAPQRKTWWVLRPRWLALTGVLAACVVVFIAVWPHSVVPSVEPKTPPVAAPPTQPEPAQKVTVAPSRKAGVRPRSPSVGKPEPVAVEAMMKKQPPNQPVPEAPVPRPSAAPNEHAPRTMAVLNGRAYSALQPPAGQPRPVASLAGSVHDASGAAIPGATVDIVDASTNSTTHTTADANGQFMASSLPPGGPYTVTTSKPGFQKDQRTVTLQAGQPEQIDIPLRLGEMAETVTVAAAATPPPPAQNLTQVAVLDFANGHQQNQSGAKVADLLSAQLRDGGQVRVIDRQKVQQAAQSQEAKNKPPTAKQAAAVGRQVGADAVVVGSVEAPASNVSVKAQVIDTKRATSVATVAASGPSLQLATNSLGNQIESNLAKPTEGSVTRRKGEVVSVRFLSPPALQIGARCGVFHGARKIGELVITSIDGSSASGKFYGTGHPRAGDRVRLPSVP